MSVDRIYPTQDWVLDACQRRNTTLDNPGWCCGCGEEVEGCEPDARRYTCDSCGKDLVYGAEEYLLRNWMT